MTGVVWGLSGPPGHPGGGLPGTGMSGLPYGVPSADADPYTQVEHDTRATVAAPWWPTATPLQRHQALAGRLLAQPDHTWWFYGAWARWYRWHPADGRWFPCPRPAVPAARSAAIYPQPGLTPPAVPAELLPTGPDYAFDFGTPLAVAGRPLSGATLSRLQRIISEASLAPVPDYPLAWNQFLHGTPSTVAAAWSTLLWCADVPLFDPAIDGPLLELWQPYLARPPQTHGRLRWLTAPPLRTTIGLFAERLAAGRPDAAGQIARHMAMTAQALRDDPRFHARATALLAMIEPIQVNPAVDQPALAYGEGGVEREWLRRCPAQLACVLFGDTAPGERLQMAVYDLATTLEPFCGDPLEAGYVEPRHAAVSLLACDLTAHRPDQAAPIGGWLDPELRALLHELIDQPDHPLRALWPAGGTFTESFGPPDAPAALAALGAMAAVDLAWCRLANDLPTPADGFPVPSALRIALDEAES